MGCRVWCSQADLDILEERLEILGVEQHKVAASVRYGCRQDPPKKAAHDLSVNLMRDWCSHTRRFPFLDVVGKSIPSQTRLFR